VRVIRKCQMIDSLPSPIRALLEQGISRSGRDGVGEREVIAGEGGEGWE